MVGLVEVSDAHRAAIMSGIDTHPRLPGLKVPDGWPMFLFIDSGRASIVGSGGFLAGPDSDGFVQIGYEVAPEYRGQGIATRAMLEVVSRKPAARLAAVVAPANLPSIAVLRKLGFRDTGQVIRHGGEALSLWVSK